MHWIELITIVVFAFAFTRLVVTIVNLVTIKKLPKEPQTAGIKVDVLIPARNEAENIGFLLSDLGRQSCQNFKVWVYDDYSCDDTAEIVKAYIKNGANVELLKGVGLPEGWSGKNRACYKLAQHSSGDVMVYLDADVRLSEDFLNKALSYFSTNNLQLLSFFPDQTMKTFGEKLIVPLMNWILLSVLPLRLVRKSSWTSFVAANGQCMIFNTLDYQANQWHKQVKNIPVEDIAIMKVMKQRKMNVDVLLGQNEISCRMYRSFPTAFQGLSRSAPAFFSNNIFWAVMFVFLVSAGPFFIYWALTGPIFLIFMGMIFLSKIIIAYLSNQSTLMNVIFHPLHLVMLPVVVFSGLINKIKGRYTWKGRSLKLNFPG